MGIGFRMLANILPEITFEEALESALARRKGAWFQSNIGRARAMISSKGVKAGSVP